MSITMRAGSYVVTEVSEQNKREFEHVMGLHELLVDGDLRYGPGTYAQCIQFRQDACTTDEIMNDRVVIQPYFDTSAWANQVVSLDEYR